MKTFDEPLPLYHQGARSLQDRFDTRRLADRIEQTLARVAFTEDDKAFIERMPMFFLASADADGCPDVSYKGGRPGFVRVLDECTLAFPSYDGNGMFRSLGNVQVNPAVAMLFIDFARPSRLRVLGHAGIDPDDPLMESYPGAQLVVRVRARRIFPNCPRYIHRMAVMELSEYAPAEGHVPPVPAWKRFEVFRDVLPRGDPARGDSPD